jgi:histidinol dehydrogenase
LIVGPGNIYVTLAKKLLAGQVGIDMIAGPSEILVIADSSANPHHIAADLLSQAEHDPMASALMLTADAALAETTAGALKEQLAELPRREVAEESLSAFGGIVVVNDLDTAIALANKIAPEHLELLVEQPFQFLGKIKNAGAVFLGHHTPEPVGDYFAGPNHVLPTAGTARFASGLSVDHFTKKTSVISYSSEALLRDAADIMRLAELEGLEAHARSVRVRLEED